MATALTACAPADLGTQQTNKTLTFWDASVTQYVSYGRDFTVAIAEFEKKFPKVELIIEKHDVGTSKEGIQEFYQELATACMAGQGPDIVYSDSTFMVTQDIFKIQQSGAFADLTDFIANDKEFDVNDYNKVILDGVKYEDKQYIMPLSYKIPMIYSQRETFEREGFNEENFGTAEGIIDEFIAFRERNSTNDKKLLLVAGFLSIYGIGYNR